MTQKESTTPENQEKTQGESEVIDWEKIAKYKAAELENYIKRQKDAVSNAFNDGRTHVILSVLPILDNLRDAMNSMKDETDREGVAMLGRKFESILSNLGVEEIVVKKGDVFDPYIHNCAATGESSEKKVVEVWQKGYKFAGRVIRPVTVKI